ncbi:MAG: SdrD B-like protein [Frankiales bacterium]|nr:SdrD B-like protein [Frankiales bacterium]
MSSYPHRNSRRIRAVAVILGMALAVLGITGLTAAASAKTISGAITGVTVAPATVTTGQQVTTSITWQVPNGTKAGDTFTLSLDPKLNHLPGSFSMRDASGNLVATAVISTGTPAVVTFTMTDYAAHHIHVTGTAFVVSNYSATTGAQQFVYTSGDGTSFSAPVTVTASPPNRAHANKFGLWTRADQGRENPIDFLQWVLETKTGPFDSAVLSDNAQSPQTIDCATVTVAKGDTSGPGGRFNNGVAYPSATVTCSASSLTVQVGAAQAGQLYRVKFSVSVPAATGDTTAPITYDNTATATTAGGPGATVSHPAAAMVQSSAGGAATGTNVTPAVSIIKDDTAGHAADTAATAVSLPDGSTGLVFTITNSGTEPLTSVVVSDHVVANGTVTGLSCTFPDGTKGTTWAGPFAPAGSFKCTAALAGVRAGTTLHQDIATVNAVGQVSSTPVTASNGYFASVPSVSVGDYVWTDTNHNGVQDSGETGIGGVTLTITDVHGKPVTDVNGKLVGPTKTDSNGKYGFTNLPPGQYVVHLASSTVPSGLSPTLTGQGTRATDSSTGSSTSLVLAGGQQDLTLDFGFYVASITDVPPSGGTTTTPPSSTTDTTTPDSGVDSVSAVNAGTTVNGVTTATDSPPLPNTGADIRPTFVLGLLLAGAGATMLFFGRRRRYSKSS